MRSGRLYARATSAHLIDESGSSSSLGWPTPLSSDANGTREDDGKRGVGLNTWVTKKWPTPTAGDTKASGSRNLPGSAAHAGVSLADAVIHGGSTTPREWPTPTSTHLTALSNHRSGKKRHAQDSMVSLPEAVRCWPTPRAEDSESAGAHRGVPDTLTSAIRHWPTPQARDEKGPFPNHRKGGRDLSSEVHLWPTPSATPYGSSQNGINGKGGEFERPSAATPSLETRAKKEGGVLNPAWVETLMGAPIGWTAGPPVPAKRKKTGSRHARSRKKPIRTGEPA